MDYILGSISVLLIGYIAYKDWISKDTVKDMSAKIMARDVKDYVYMANAETTTPSVPLIDENLVPLEDSDVWRTKEDFLKAINSGKTGTNGK